MLLGCTLEVASASRADPEAGLFIMAAVDHVQIACSMMYPETARAVLLPVAGCLTGMELCCGCKACSFATTSTVFAWPFGPICAETFWADRAKGASPWSTRNWASARRAACPVGYSIGPIRKLDVAAIATLVKPRIRFVTWIIFKGGIETC